jgi:hypothetical protein
MRIFEKKLIKKEPALKRKNVEENRHQQQSIFQRINRSKVSIINLSRQ